MRLSIIIPALLLLWAMPSTIAGAADFPPNRPLLPTVPLTPRIKIGPPVHHETKLSDRKKELIRQFLTETDLLLERDLPEQGYIIQAVNRRIVITTGNRALVHFPAPVAPGTTLTAFRPGKPLTDPDSGEVMGILTHRLGTLRVDRIVPQGLLAEVVSSHRDMEAGDRLVRTRTINLNFRVHDEAPFPIRGRVLAIQNDLEVAAGNQVVMVGLGRHDRAVQGLTLKIIREGALVPDPDPDSDKKRLIAMPPETIANATLFHIGERASFALLSDTRRPVRRGDWISTP